MRATASERVGVSGAPPPPSGARGPLIHVATRCESLDDFIEKFAGLASEGALVLPASGELPIGTEGRFAIRLKDQSVAMRGRCRVTDARPAPSAPAGAASRPTLLRVALLDMEESSASVHRRLLARRRAAAAVPVHVLPEPSDPTEVSPPKSAAPSPGRPAPPPVSALAATMIGVAPPRARAGTSPLGVPRAPALAEPRAPGTPFTLPPNPLSARAGETRVPGASFTLPANPLSEMNATDLASFIDSTLFESDDEDATAERPAKPPTDLEETVQRPPPDSAIDLGRTVQSAPQEPMVQSASERAEPTERTAYAQPPGAIAPAAAGARAPRRIAMRALPYVLCVVAGVAIGHALRRAPPAPVVVVAPPPAVVAPLPVTPPPVAEIAKPEPPPAPAPVAPAPAAAKPEPPPARAEPVEAPAPPVRERHAPAAHAARASDEAGGCQVNVVTEPPDAKIAWSGKPLGATPLAEAAIACGEGTLTITHERYETVTKTLTAETGVPVALDERLHRPPATLVVSSSPPGAAISLNGHPVGTAPRRVPTLRYEHLTIKASLPGYAPWTKKIYLTAETLQVSAQLAGGGHKR